MNPNSWLKWLAGIVCTTFLGGFLLSWYSMSCPNKQQPWDSLLSMVAFLPCHIWSIPAGFAGLIGAVIGGAAIGASALVGIQAAEKSRADERERNKVEKEKEDWQNDINIIENIVQATIFVVYEIEKDIEKSKNDEDVRIVVSTEGVDRIYRTIGIDNVIKTNEGKMLIREFNVLYFFLFKRVAGKTNKVSSYKKGVEYIYRFKWKVNLANHGVRTHEYCHNWPEDWRDRPEFSLSDKGEVTDRSSSAFN